MSLCPFFAEDGVEDLFPLGVAFGAEVEEIVAEVGADGFAGGIGQVAVAVEVADPVFALSPGLQEGVEFLDLGDLGFAFEGDFDGGDEDAGGGQLGVDEIEEAGVVGKGLLDGEFRIEVVAAGVGDQKARFIAEDGFLSINDEVIGDATAEAAIEDGKIGKIGFQAFPEADAGTAGEDDAAFARLCFGEGGDLFGETFGLGPWGGGCRGGRWRCGGSGDLVFGEKREGGGAEKEEGEEETRLHENGVTMRA